MGKRHAKGPRSRRGDAIRVQPPKKSGLLQRASGPKAEVEGKVRPLRFRVPPFGLAVTNRKGYPRLWSGKYRGQYLYRAVWEKVAKKKIPEGFQIHHMNGKLCWCPHQLVALGPGLHVHPEPIRDPYTGEYMTREAFDARYDSRRWEKVCEVP